MLRQLANSGLRIGINLYLTPDESHNADGKHIGCLSDLKFDGCNDELKNSLSFVVNSQRSISALESMNLMPNAIYYHEALHSPSPAFSRRDRHTSAMKELKPAGIVFLDPDNGIQVKSVSERSKKSNKFATRNEIADYFAAGKSVIFYNHRCREPEAIYLRRFEWLYENSAIKDGVKTGITFRRGTTRDFVFALQLSHADGIMACVNDILGSPWVEHFAKLKLSC
ncbi:MAG: hypothetical protein PHP02_02240 [Eubacteriales bacterium]|nr:hypothetical protein [Eubacteriales bacterium]